MDDKIEISLEEQLLGESVTIAEIPDTERNDIMRDYLSLMREFEEKRYGRGIMLKSGCVNLLVKTLRCCTTPQESQVDKDAKKTKSWIHIEKTIEYLHSTSEIPDNDTIADYIGVSPNYLTKVFQEYLGMSLHRYIMNITIERAQQILLSGKANITETAEKCGFSSIHVFSKTFRNMVGISPSEFINRSVSREQLVVSMQDLTNENLESKKNKE
ncbi:MAG: helix-turn-helix transcriptional regulator [bacterium]|nr:helix-turn-helix transcriptional regulator [bacterium]